MGHLKKVNVKKCVSILRTFIDESREEDERKGVAIQALGQLQKITAGTDTLAPQCYGRPRAGLIP